MLTQEVTTAASGLGQRDATATRMKCEPRDYPQQSPPARFQSPRTPAARRPPKRHAESAGPLGRRIPRRPSSASSGPAPPDAAVVLPVLLCGPRAVRRPRRLATPDFRPPAPCQKPPFTAASGVLSDGPPPGRALRGIPRLRKPLRVAKKEFAKIVERCYSILREGRGWLTPVAQACCRYQARAAEPTRRTSSKEFQAKRR